MKILTILVLLFVVHQVCAQKTTYSDSLRNKNLAIRAGAMGTLIYPGLKAGVEWPIKYLQRVRIKKSREKVVYKQRYLSGSIAFYNHKDYHTNVFLLAEWQMRRMKPSGFFTEFAPGIGVSRTFLGGTTYRVNGNQQVEKVSLAGYTYAALSLSYGIGLDLRQKSNKNLAFYFKPSILVLFPYNSYLYARPIVEMGMIKTIKQKKQ
jgi:hypothetical protein